MLIGNSQVSLLTMYGYVPNPYQINIFNSKDFVLIADSLAFLILVLTTPRHQLSPPDLLISSHLSQLSIERTSEFWQESAWYNLTMQYTLFNCHVFSHFPDLDIRKP